MILPAVEIKAAKPLEILMLSGAAYLGIRSFTPLVLGLMALPSQPAMSQGYGDIPSRFVKVVQFSDRNRTYSVNLETGRVSFSDDATTDPEPAPQPPTPPNPPAPVVVKPAWVSLFVSPAKTDVQWLDDEAVRTAAAEASVRFRGFRSTESEVDALGFRRLVREATVPCIVIQDEQGKVLLSRKVADKDDVIRAIREVK